MVCVQECSPIVERGIVIQVLDRAFDVLVQRYGVIKRVYCEVLWYIYVYTVCYEQNLRHLVYNNYTSFQC